MADGQAGLSPLEAEMFARGLYWLASSDGIDEREESMIDEFVKDCGVALDAAALKERAFDPREAAALLSTRFLKEIFLKAAVALVRADGSYSAGERLALAELVDAFGLSNFEFAQLELSVEPDAL